MPLIRAALWFVVQVLIVAGASLRLTRLVTRDTISEQLVIRHIRNRARFETSPASRQLGMPLNLAGYLIELADCPYCVGWWSALTCTLIEFLVPTMWPSLLLGAFGLSYVVGHVSSRMDGED